MMGNARFPLLTKQHFFLLAKKLRLVGVGSRVPASEAVGRRPPQGVFALNSPPERGGISPSSRAVDPASPQ